MDRVLDLYVMVPMQAIVSDFLRDAKDRDPMAVAKARDTLSMAYTLLDKRLAHRTWAAGNMFSMADCTAAPALFYASTLVPFPQEHRALHAYFERLMERPSVKRTMTEAQPFFQYYPFHSAIPARFLATAA